MAFSLELPDWLEEELEKCKSQEDIEQERMNDPIYATMEDEFEKYMFRRLGYIKIPEERVRAILFGLKKLMN